MTPLTKELKDRYPFTCPVCKVSLDAAPSILMQMGMNHGGGSCLHCKAFLHLDIDEEAVTMKADTYEDFVKREYPETSSAQGETNEARVD